MQGIFGSAIFVSIHEKLRWKKRSEGEMRSSQRSRQEHSRESSDHGKYWWWYKAWTKFILFWAIYSSFFTPMEFGFFRGLPKKFFLLDIAGQITFLIDIAIRFFVPYKDKQTNSMVYNRNHIAIRYLKSGFLIDLLGCLPWDNIYRASGRKEEVRYLLWIRLSRVRIVATFFEKLEKDIRINYLFIRIVKLIVVELYYTHTAACIFYYLATTLPPSQEGYTWIGSLKLGDYTYTNFREIDLLKRYLTSLYFAIVTMATVGYGDIHAVNSREMIFIMIYLTSDMLLGAYLVGNMTALIVKGSKTEIFRDKLKDLTQYMSRNKIGTEICAEIKSYMLMEYERRNTKAVALQDIPISLPAKILQKLYKPYIEKVPLFKECSKEFINEIANRLHEEFFYPEKVIIEKGDAIDQLYFVCDGELVGTGEDGQDMLLEPNSSFGEIAILCNIPQPYTVRIDKPCRLLRVDKQSFSNILQIYVSDRQTILRNLLGGKEYNHIKHLQSVITLYIRRQEAKLALCVNNAAFQGDLDHLKGLVQAGADPNKTDYDGRSPLHLAASKGYEDITYFLIQEGVDINISDKFGNTPLLEAIKNGHDGVASLLAQEGASLNIDDAGCFLCKAVIRGDSDFLRRILSHGVDPNSKDYDHRTPLHVAAAEGSVLMAKLLLEEGASVLSKDRWGNTPLDESRMSGSKPLIALLENAKSSQLSEIHISSHEILEPGNGHSRKCTVYPFHPWFKEEEREGVVLPVPRTVEDLIRAAEERLKCTGCHILEEDAGKITDTDMVYDGQKLYLVTNDQGSH
ncbi:potassium channel SKOR isoform X1 [Cinnamomum micranthum f. kanehirae]|uniref:Potassium channel n=1 Tax=Cinnamomum micranthum f. kanehirae TaxID=337451 RepID=A0A3S3P8M9_9MAGN|nr:potassium channel SKOR isoform X1 [Cinnamomum micranthum f. kanehirae]